MKGVKSELRRWWENWGWGSSSWLVSLYLNLKDDFRNLLCTLLFVAQKSGGKRVKLVHLGETGEYGERDGRKRIR